jgi:hypothetical protein
MKSRLAWILGNYDVLVALALAIAASILGLAGKVSDAFLSSATVLALGAIGIVMLHDRALRESLNAIIVRELGTIPEALRMSTKVQILSGGEIGHALAQARQDTEIWLFKGSTATFVRAVTLPECVSAARKNGRPLVVRLEILDPTNLAACERYTRLYHQLADTPSAPERRWTVKNTQMELCATILAACCYRTRYDLLEIDVALSSTVTTFRWEMSSNCFIITQQGPRFPATLVQKDHLYFDCWATEIRTSFQQGRRLLIDQVEVSDLGDEPSVEEVRNTFRSLGLGIIADLTDEDVGELVRMAIHDTDPYGPSLRRIDRY